MNQVKLENVKFTAPYERVREGDSVRYNCGINIQSEDSVIISNVTLTEEACAGTRYNAIEIDLDNKVGARYIDIDGLNIEGKLSNNGILIFNVQDDAVINIKNVHMKKCSNPIRFSNGLNAKNVTINIENMTIDEWDGSEAWRGLLILEDYTSTNAAQAYERNLFAEDKVTVNIKNLVHAGQKVMPTSDEEIFGYNEGRIIFRVLDNVDGNDTNIYSAETRGMYPTVKFE